VDANSGTPLVIDRQGNMRPAGTGAGVAPSIKPSGEMVTKETSLGNMQETVSRLKKAWSPKFTGAGQAVWGKMGEWIGTTAEEQVKFYADLQSVRDELLRAKSGAQINEQEYQRLKSILPDEYKADNSFKARMDRFETELNVITQKRRQAKQGLGTPNATKKQVGRFIVEQE
jgi:hypothetical protein